MRRLVLAAGLFLAGCSRSGVVEPGATVSLDYELSSGGAVIESSAGREPLVVVQGEGNLPGPVDEALAGMKVGEEKMLELTTMQSFGLVDPDKVRKVPLAKFGTMAKELKPGSVVAGATDRKAAQGRVVSVEKDFAVLDFNHPLAGKPLRYKIKVVAIR